MKQKLEKEHIVKIKELQSFYSQLITQLGEFNFEKNQILKDFEQKENFLKEIEQEFISKNEELHLTLFEKYGNGKINLEEETIETE